AAYQPLVEALPKAFELEGERDRREPIILRALLALVPDLSPLAVEKLFAAGLVRLEAIARARADELAVVTGLEPALAQRLLDLVRAERALAAADRRQERRHLAELAARLGDEHRSLERAAAGWSRWSGSTRSSACPSPGSWTRWRAFSAMASRDGTAGNLTGGGSHG